MFEVDLTTQITKYGKDNPDWGGPACCKMAMDGYPPGSASCLIDQTTIFNRIHAHNKEPGAGPWGLGWVADPFAVTKALNDLCPPQYQWIDVSDYDQNKVLYQLLCWMAKYQYPALVCTNRHDYWDLLVFYQTADDPRVVTNTTLLQIGVYVPVPGDVVYDTVDGVTWLTGPFYWGHPCPDGQIWKDKWVGIGEPPVQEGSIRTEEISRIGARIISPGDAAKIARRFLAKRGREDSGLLARRLPGLKSATPLLVKELPFSPKMEETGTPVRYYIVPFCQPSELDAAGQPMARLSVLINACTGRFEEMCLFPKPVRYLPRNEVLQIASRNLRLSRRETQELETELVFRPLRPHVSSALPAWCVKKGEKKFFVTQGGLVFGTLTHIGFLGA